MTSCGRCRNNLAGAMMFTPPGKSWRAGGNDRRRFDGDERGQPVVALSLRYQVRPEVWRQEFCLAEPLHNAMNPEPSSLDVGR